MAVFNFDEGGMCRYYVVTTEVNEFTGICANEKYPDWHLC